MPAETRGHGGDAAEATLDRLRKHGVTLDAEAAADVLAAVAALDRWHGILTEFVSDEDEPAIGFAADPERR